MAAAEFIRYAEIINGRQAKTTWLDVGAKALFEALPGIMPMIRSRSPLVVFLGDVANRWERDAESDERAADAVKDASRTHGFGSTFAQTAMWRRRCATSIRNFLNYYRFGDDAENLAVGDGPTVVK